METAFERSFYFSHCWIMTLGFGGSTSEVPMSRFACLDDDEQFRIWCVVLDQSTICSRSSARMVIRILFVSWAVFLLASQLICGCATFLHWLSAG